jgi:hypothetical protein
MKKSMNRREVVVLLGGVAAAGGVGTLLRADQAPSPSKPGEAHKLPWPYKPLDPDVTAQRAFDGYNKHHCMYGAFEAVVAPIAEQLGSPYKDFPFDMFTYGAGGINGWATVCGALNGAAAAFQLFSAKPEPLIDTLFAWYESEPLPNFYPKGAKFPEVRSVAKLPLCHQSIAEWCKVSNKKAYSDQRKERCGTITASVARQAVILLNAQAEGKPLALALSKETQSCMTCHEKAGALENMRTKMNCGGCHAPLMGKHPLKTT